MAYLSGDYGLEAPQGSTPAAFDHYDDYGQPIDTDGNVMTGTPWGTARYTPPPEAWTRPDALPVADPDTGLASTTPPPEETTPPPEETAGPPPASTTTPPPASTTTPPPSSGTSGSSGLAVDNPFGAWTGHYTAPTPLAMPDAPVFTPPTYTPPPAFSYDVPQPVYKQAPAFTYADYVPPTMADALNDPGYQFRLGQGLEALQNAASARGTLNDSGTLKAFIDYGQNAASQEYGNIWNRSYGAWDEGYKNAIEGYKTNVTTQFDDPYNAALKAWTTGHDTALDTYNTNYSTQYKDPYTFSYQAAKDEFAPVLADYQTRVANAQQTNALTNTNSWNEYALGWQDFNARRNLGANFALQS